MHAESSTLSFQEAGLRLRLRVPGTGPIPGASRFVMGEPKSPGMLRACCYRDILLGFSPIPLPTSGIRWCMAPQCLPEPAATRADIRAAAYSATSVLRPETAPLVGLLFRRW